VVNQITVTQNRSASELNGNTFTGVQM